MIDSVLLFVLDELNVFLSSRFQSSEKHAVLSNVVELDGSESLAIEDKLILSFVNIQREGGRPAPVPQLSPGSHAASGREFTISLLISANLGGHHYAGSLQLLSAAIRFFEDRAVLPATLSPDLPPEIERISVEMANMTFQELENLWSLLGGRYLPSALYKVRVTMT
jgi:hypothetical protein